MTTDTHSNNANNIHYKAMFVMKVPFTMTLSLESKKTKQYRIEYLTTQKIESDGPIRILVRAKLSRHSAITC